MIINNDISVIITVSSRQLKHDIEALFYIYKKAVEASYPGCEFIYVTDDASGEITEPLINLQQKGENIKIVKLAKWFGDAAALNIGFDESSGKIILTLPAFQQVDADEIPRLINSFSDSDMVIARRSRIKDGFFMRLQAKVFHRLAGLILGIYYRDLGCRVRIFKREVLENIKIYGDQIRFLPLLANRFGFKVTEKEVKQFQSEAVNKVYSLGHYTERLVDLISIFFLLKFTKKPLRFFGVPGLIIFAAGSVLALYLLYQRLFIDIPLADKPIVLVSILLIVFGIQLFAIGLVAEIIIFIHSKDSKEYIIEEIITKESLKNKNPDKELAEAGIL
jgi:glycosyltransferase involved in cell wall biosynthesis